MRAAGISRKYFSHFVCLFIYFNLYSKGTVAATLPSIIIYSEPNVFVTVILLSYQKRARYFHMCVMRSVRG